jgi:hypothetical protein
MEGRDEARGAHGPLSPMNMSVNMEDNSDPGLGMDVMAGTMETKRTWRLLVEPAWIPARVGTSEQQKREATTEGLLIEYMKTIEIPEQGNPATKEGAGGKWPAHPGNTMEEIIQAYRDDEAEMFSIYNFLRTRAPGTYILDPTHLEICKKGAMGWILSVVNFLNFPTAMLVPSEQYPIPVPAEADGARGPASTFRKVKYNTEGRFHLAQYMYDPWTKTPWKGAKKPGSAGELLELSEVTAGYLYKEVMELRNAIVQWAQQAGLCEEMCTAVKVARYFSQEWRDHRHSFFHYPDSVEEKLKALLEYVECYDWEMVHLIALVPMEYRPRTWIKEASRLPFPETRWDHLSLMPIAERKRTSVTIAFRGIIKSGRWPMRTAAIQGLVDGNFVRYVGEGDPAAREVTGPIPMPAKISGRWITPAVMRREEPEAKATAPPEEEAKFRDDLAREEIERARTEAAESERRVREANDLRESRQMEEFQELERKRREDQETKDLEADRINRSQLEMNIRAEREHGSRANRTVSFADTNRTEPIKNRNWQAGRDSVSHAAIQRDESPERPVDRTKVRKARHRHQRQTGEK